MKRFDLHSSMNIPSLSVVCCFCFDVMLLICSMINFTLLIQLTPRDFSPPFNLKKKSRI